MENKLTDIFTKTECIESKTLKAYVDAELNKEETRLVEEHLSFCPICSDIVDGLMEMPKDFDLDAEVILINNKIDEQINSNRKNIFKNLKFDYKLIAAAIILALVISTIIMLNYTPHHYYSPDELAKHENINSDQNKSLTENVPYEAEEEMASDLLSQNNQQAPQCPTVLNDDRFFKTDAEKDEEPILKNDRDYRTTTVSNDTKDQSEKVETIAYGTSGGLIDAKSIDSEEIVFIEDTKKNVAEAEQSPRDKLVFTISDEYPQFPGGENEMNTFINKNMVYPEDAIKNNVEGIVYVQVVVDKQGKLQNIEIAKGITQSLNEEALKIIKLMPSWIPAKRNGNTIDSKYVIKIEFKLPK